MVDSFAVGVGCFGFGPPRPGRTKAAEFSGLAVDQAEIDGDEADGVIAGFGLGQGDRLADEGLADEDALAAPLDLARTAHAPDLDVTAVIGRRLDAARIGP